jgi:hypothetical protein
MGFEDAPSAMLIELMRSEIELGCPNGDTYGKALSIALASRVASVCVSTPIAIGRNRQA